MYLHGSGVPQARAAELFQLAAEQGLARTQIVLADIYQNGKGVPRDDAAAVSWLRKAAEQGAAEAQNKLGIGYFIGQGIEPDEALAAV
jgi:TPR repeat protein